MRVGRTGSCLFQAAGTGRTTIEYGNFSGPSRSRWDGPDTAHRDRLHEIDALGMDARQFALAGCQAGANDHGLA